MQGGDRTNQGVRGLASLVREIEMFGENFERFVPEEDDAPAAPTTTSDGPAKAVDKAKKGKVAAKAIYPPICIVSFLHPAF